jgi:hypothetical protein
MYIKQEYISCNCDGEGMVISNDEDFVYVAIFNYSRWSSIMSWKERLRWCWHIVRHGWIWNDEIVLSPSRVKMLSKVLIRHSEQSAHKKKDSERGGRGKNGKNKSART